MAAAIVRGFPITLDLFVTDNDGNAFDPPDTLASIVDPNGTVIISLDTPTNVAVGHYQYTYPVAADAELGAWAIRWFGTVNGSPLSDEDGFTVVLPGFMSTGGTGDGETCEPWATHEDAIGPCADYGVDPDELDVWMQVSTDVLYNLTGRRWGGVCSDTIRPQAQWRHFDGPPMWWPNVYGMLGWGFCSCHRERETGCARVPEIRLPKAPVVLDSVVVKIDGAVFSEHRVDDSRYLVRTDGEGWPCCQDLRADDTADRTFSITYSHGARPPVGGKRMAALYGCQLLSAVTPALAGQCKLPDRVVQIVRQGTTTRFAEPSTLISAGMTGIPTVDLWVKSIVEGQKNRRATILVPGWNRTARRANH